MWGFLSHVGFLRVTWTSSPALPSLPSLLRGCGNVVLPFLRTQSERFRRTDQLIIRLRSCSHDFIRMLMRNVFVNVFKSDAVIWWAAIFRTPSSMFDKLLPLSKSESFAMSCSRRHDLREAVGNLLIVTFVSTWRVRRLAPLRITNRRAAELSVHSTIVPGEHLHNLLHWSFIAIPSQTPPTSAISSDSPELKHTVFCFLENAYIGYHVFSTELLTQTAVPE